MNSEEGKNFCFALLGTFATMLTKDEKSFLEYWEKNRERDKNVWRKFLYGSPWGLIFALPILLAVIFHGWYKNMIYISPTLITLIIIGVLGIAVFFTLFSMQFKWDRNEQTYKELKFKKKKEDTANL
ncbi:MAG: hypothetical protein ABI237_18620 [Ginsengibacter sp.]